MQIVSAHFGGSMKQSGNDLHHLRRTRICGLVEDPLNWVRIVHVAGRQREAVVGDERQAASQMLGVAQILSLGWRWA
jgi:hypothetical protein